MTELSERYRRGAATQAQIYPVTPSEDPTDFERVTVEHLFGEIWPRPGLTTRDRRLLILGVAAAQGNERILRLQFRSGLEKGDLTERDLTEVPLFLTHYVGWPLGVAANAVATKVAEERAAS
jgi:4-carboxymuconolactone decarboxylase